MSKLSLFAQIKTFIASHLVPVIITSTVVVVSITAGVVAIVMNSSSEQNVSDASEPTLEQNHDSKSKDTKTDDNGNNSDSSDNQISENNTSSDTQKPTETPKPTTSSNQTTNNQPSQSQSTSKPNNSNNSNASSTQTPTQTVPGQSTTPTQPATPTEPEKAPDDNRIWGNPYIYKENGVYYCDRGNGFVKCKTFAEMFADGENVGCGIGEVKEGYKPSQYGCWTVPEDFE